MIEQKPYEHSLKWTIYGMSVAALLFILAAVYGITRIIDGQWTSWQLPVILAIVYIVTVTISAMFTSITDINDEINKANVKEKTDVKKETKAK